MAIDTPARHIYSGDGSTRVFPIPTYIQGDDYIRIEINGVHQIDRSKWDIVNNSIIFVTAPITTATIDVQVATSVEALSELGNVTNVDIVAGNIASINGIASNLDEILEADNNAVIAINKANEASASALIATTKASEALASSTSALASATIATTKASEASISASTATTKASEALSSATSASSSAITASSGATTATTKAGEASTSASNALTSENKAKKWADESEDVPVESGLYSAKHWASKAAEIVGAGLIDDVTPSTSTVFSSTRSNNTYEPKNSNIQGHISNNTTNPHNVTKSQIGLSNVDNTSDANKPISNATSTALNSKQDTLVSGTNIKTINGSSVLGSGDVVVGGINLSNITAYHLLQGNLAVSNSTITQGFNTTLYTSGSATTGIDMDTQWGNTVEEKFGGLVWLKDRAEATNNFWYDTIRGATKKINSNTTEAEATLAGGLTGFTSTGFTVGADTGHNSTTNNMVSWNFQTTHRITGTTNHGKAYTCHYNPFTGFTMVKYEGSGLAGHEIPHHLGRKLGFVTVKNLTGAYDWVSNGLDKYLYLNKTDASPATYIASNETMYFVDGTGAAINAASNTYIMHGWANSYFDESNKLIGNYELVPYQGTGAAGNKVKTKGKPAWVTTKRVDAVSSWYVSDNQRGSGDNLIQVNTSAAEISIDYFDYISDGFIHKSTATELNAAGGQYIALVAYDTNANGGGSYYPLASDTANVQINNALIPLAQGIDGNGAKNTILSKNETITGLTYMQGKNYVYYDKNGNSGRMSIAPNYGKVNPANGGDFYNVLTNKWFTSAGVEITNSRNYLNHIVYADNDGGVLYVEELPKTTYFDRIETFGNRVVMYLSDYGLAQVQTNKRYVIQNPFGNDKAIDCDVKVEIYYEGMWAETGWADNGGTGSNSYGVRCYSTSNGIIIRTGSAGVYAGSDVSGGPFIGTSLVLSAAARIIITYKGKTGVAK